MINNNKKSNKTVKIISVVVLVAILAGLVAMVNFNSEDNVVNAYTSRAHTNVVEIYNESVVDEDIIEISIGNAETPDNSLISQYNEFKLINDETVAFMRIRDTNMIFPLVQHNKLCYTHNKVDNCYYLYRDIYKNTSVNNKAIQYVNAHNILDADVSKFDQNTVIFGHTWKRQEGNGSAPRIGDSSDMQFGQLVSYTDINWLKEHPVLELNTGGEDSYWAPQYVAYTDCPSAATPDGYNFTVKGFTESDIEILFDRSVLSNSNQIDLETDKFLTLSTCNYRYNNGDSRFIVVFKHIEASSYGEAVEIATSYDYFIKKNDTSWVK